MTTSHRVHIDRQDTIDRIPPAEWDALVPDDAFYDSHAWLAAVELDRTARPTYWLAELGRQVVGALVTYRVHLPGLPMTDPRSNPATRNIDGHFVIAGSRRGYRTRLLTAPGIPAADTSSVVRELVRCAVSQSSSSGYDGLCFMYLLADDAGLLRSAVDARLVDLEQQAFLDLPFSSADEWIEGLSKNNRSTMRRERKKFEHAGLTCRLENLEDNIDTVARLAAATENKYGNETAQSAIARVLRHQIRAADDLARLFVTRDRAGRAIACSLQYHWRHTLYSRLYGADPELIAGAGEYSTTMFYTPITYAVRQGVTGLHLGTGSLGAKTRRGGRLENAVAAFVPAPSPRL